MWQNWQKVIVGCGTKNCLFIIVLDKTIVGLMTSIYGNDGQRYLAGTNIIIVGED